MTFSTASLSWEFRRQKRLAKTPLVNLDLKTSMFGNDYVESEHSVKGFTLRHDFNVPQLENSYPSVWGLGIIVP